MTEHNHNTCSNTDEVFRTFIGCKVVGMLHDSRGENRNAVILVFDCGWGLAFNSNGSRWTEQPSSVQDILRSSKEQLSQTKRELEYILELAGEAH